MRRLVLALVLLVICGTSSGCICQRSEDILCIAPPVGRPLPEGGGFTLADGVIQPFDDGGDHDRILSALFDGSTLTVSAGELQDWDRDPGRIEWRQPNGLFAYERPQVFIDHRRYDTASGLLTAEFRIERSGQYWKFDRDQVRKETGIEPLDPDRWVDTERVWTGTLSAIVTRPGPAAGTPTVGVVFAGENRWSAHDTAGATAFTGSGADPVRFVVTYRLSGWRD